MRLSHRILLNVWLRRRAEKHRRLSTKYAQKATGWAQSGELNKATTSMSLADYHERRAKELDPDDTD
jgi:hypothetical protein